MSNDTHSLHSTFSVNKEFSENDTRFLHVTVDVLHTGENLNGSYFKKEVVDSCIESIKNIPILGFIKCDKFSQENDFAGHEYKLVRTENGVEELYNGSCFGVVPESCNPRWVTKVADDGLEREYLQIDALMWEKFSNATNIIHRDYEKAQSMELEVASVEGHDENGLFYFDRFRFEGLCILGDQTLPAMVGANVRIGDGVNFTMSDITDSIRSELNDKFELFNATFAKLANDKSNQGGVENMSNTDLEQVVEEQPVDFEQETVEVAESDAVENKDGAEEEVVEDEVAVVEPEFAEEEAKIADIEADYEKVKSDYNEMTIAFNQLKFEYEAIKADYDEIKPKYDEYVQAEEQRKADELSALKDSKFAEYEEELGESVDFVALKEKKDELTVDEIEKECAVMYVKAFRSNNIKFSKSESGSAVVGVFEDEDSVADGYVSTKYGNIRKHRAI